MAGQGLPTLMPSSGRMAEALAAARSAWASPDLSGTDEQAIWARYGASFTPRRP